MRLFPKVRESGKFLIVIDNKFSNCTEKSENLTLNLWVITMA
jgi:hypothetical protein